MSSSTSSPAEVVVRAPEPEDAPGMARVHVESWQQTYRGLVADAILDDPGFLTRRVAFWEAAISDPRWDTHRSAVATRDDEVIGIALSGPPLGDAGRWERQLYVLYVLAHAHGSGAGALLLDAVTEADVPTMLWVADPNPRAQAFYRKSGFAFDGGRQVEDGLVELRMVRG